MLSIEQIEAFYGYFYAARYNDRKYKFKASKATRSVCNTFLEIIDKEYSLQSVGESFLWDYFIFQFQYWEDLTFDNKFTDKIVIAWIVGKKAFNRWKERDREFDWQIEKAAIIEKYGLQKNSLIGPKIVEEVDSGHRFFASSLIRKQYLNTPPGFAMCVEFTTLFDPADMSCIRCNNRADCKELLRANYPKIYEQRIN